MSYAGPAPRSRPAPSDSRDAPPAGGTSRRSILPTMTERIAEHSDGTDWQQVALFGAGLTLGLVIGAGAALLTAPRSGTATRAVIRGRARSARLSAQHRGQDAWEGVRDELLGLGQALRRQKRRRSAARALERELDQELDRETARELRYK